MKIKVLDQSFTEVTRERDPNDEWDGEDTDTSHYIEGIEISEDYYDLETGFALESGKDYYLVYGIYSTGDSFHREEGAIAFIQLYLTKDKAQKCITTLQKHYDSYKENYEL